MAHLSDASHRPAAPTPSAHPPRHHRWLIGAVPVIMVLMFVVPYTLLREVNAWYGSFLFWTVSTLIVMGICAYVSRSWED